MGASAVNDQSSDNAPKSHTKSEQRTRLSITTYRLRLYSMVSSQYPCTSLRCWRVLERNLRVVLLRPEDRTLLPINDYRKLVLLHQGAAPPRQPAQCTFDIHAPRIIGLRMTNSPEQGVAPGTHFAFQDFWLLVDGFYIWEFLTTLDLEWDVIRGRRPHRWTIWIYSITRLATLTFVVINILSIGVPIPISCQVTIGSQFIVSYLALATSSLMIALRVIAIWGKNRTIVAIATGIWGTNVVFLIQGAARFRSSWDWEISNCVLYLDSVRLSTISTFVTDIILVLMMLFGLYRLRRHGGLMALGRLLWNQGVVWILIVVVAELTPTVFICLDLNGTLNIIFLIPWVITMSVASTRMYRSLSDLLSSDFLQKSLPTSGRTASATDGTPTTPTFLTGVHVTEHRAHEQPSTPQANYFGKDITGQPHVKPHDLNVDPADDYDLESGSEIESCDIN
ncbi:hypothetical protein BGY98DRAFT_96152 [Russula aff. rugulosa BPL654]|nr:hypothetical protein BGY98DRAFT_96152 [Russula aff. rugulosa BPL654]